MPESSILLFSGNPHQDRKTLIDFIDGYGEAVGEVLDVDEDAIDKVVQSLNAMPWPNGTNQSSAFKKVGMIVSSFVFYAPIISPLPVGKFGPLYLHQNAIVAYEIAKSFLHNATVVCPFRGEIKLENRVYTSKHFWQELISTLSGCNPRDHFFCLSLLFESLVYRANPDACYTKLMARANPDSRK